MSLQRSKSAPHPISGLTPTSLTRTTSFHYKQAKTGHATPIHTPRVEKEDPFSLSGFFPRIFGDDDDEWGWLRDEKKWVGADKVVELVEEEDEEDDSRVIFGQTESESVTRETIKDEDKLGILSFESLFAGVDRRLEEHLLSPYSDGEAVDHESLYLALRSRRTALSAVGSEDNNFDDDDDDNDNDSNSKRSDLFDPAGTGSRLGWRTATLAAIDEYFPIWEIGSSARERHMGDAGIKRSELSHEV